MSNHVGGTSPANLEYHAQCDQCNAWRIITESQHDGYSGTLVPFCCTDVGHVCQRHAKEADMSCNDEPKANTRRLKIKRRKGKRAQGTKAKAKAKGKSAKATKKTNARAKAKSRHSNAKKKKTRKDRRTKDDLARAEAESDRQAAVFDPRLLSEGRDLCRAHGIKRTITVSNGPARGWHVSGFLVDNSSVAARERSKVYDTAVRWRFESPRRSRVFKVWKSTKANVPSLADAVSEGAFVQIRRVVRPDVLRKLKVKRAAVEYRESQTYKRQRSGPLSDASSQMDVDESSLPALTIGDSVKVVGLQQRQDLNGLVGKLLYRIKEKARWAVSIFGDNDGGDPVAVINVKPQNLVLCDPSSSCSIPDKATPIAHAVSAAPEGDDPSTRFHTLTCKNVFPSCQQVSGTWICECLHHLKRLPHCTGEGPHMVHLQSRMTKFGRGEGNHVPLRSSKTPQMLSRNHAVILQESSRCLLVDQGSLNGVLLNGVRVYGEQPLKPGDVLTFGVTTPEPEFDYVLEERPAS